MWKTVSECKPSDLAKTYRTLPSISIDIGIMEKADNRFIIPADMQWSDVGSWNALHELLAKTPDANVSLSGELTAIDATGCLVRVSPGKQVALIGVSDLIIVEEGDKLLIIPRCLDQRVKEASKKLDK